MTKTKLHTETKSRPLATVLDFLNADFTSKAGKREGWANYYLHYLTLEQAREIQGSILEAYGQGKVTSALVELVNEHATSVAWQSGADRHSLRMVADTSQPGGGIVVFLISVLNDRRFWRISRCKQCSRFFFPRLNRRYCSKDCLKESNIQDAQARVERTRRARRWKEIKNKLRQFQKLARRLPLSEMLDRFPRFDSKLLAEIIETDDLRTVGEKVKYKNRKILMEAKL